MTLSKAFTAGIVAIVLGGCAAQAPRALYGWGSYEDIIYASTTKADGLAPERQIEIMTKDRATISAAGQRLREDAVTESDRHAEFQAVAPAVEGGLYLVPRVIE